MSDDRDSSESDDAETRGDPFDDLSEEVADREGDPFDHLEDESATDGQPMDDSEPAFESDPDADIEREPTTDFEGDFSPDPTVEPRAQPTQETAQSPADTEGPTDESDSMPGESDSSKMTFGVGRDKTSSSDEQPLMDGVQREGDPFERMGGAFEEMEVGAVDPDEVWQDLASAESRGSVGKATERTYADVSKHAYCEQCEHFSGPPEIRCNHEGTEIVEFLDMKTVRVVDCPIVAEREALEEDSSVAAKEETIRE